jgi:hypothetical protein
MLLKRSSHAAGEEVTILSASDQDGIDEVIVWNVEPPKGTRQNRAFLCPTAGVPPGAPCGEKRLSSVMFSDHLRELDTSKRQRTKTSAFAALWSKYTEGAKPSQNQACMPLASCP